MSEIDLNAVKLLVRRCLDNAEGLLDSAKDIRAKKRNHIAFHLAVLALEEIGKTAMLLADKVCHVAEAEDSDQSKGESQFSNDLADHRKKLFWAMLITGFDGGVFSPQDFIRLKEIANDIHLSRVMSLYTNNDEETPQTAISDDQLDRIIGATEARLNLEKFKEIRKLDSEGEQLIDWLMKALEDPLLQRFVLSEQSKHKLAEFSGNSRKWMTWLREEVATSEANAKEMMEKEINRVAPTGVLANKPKWRLKIKLHTLSHSIRHKELNTWNDRVAWVKLYPTAKKTELLVEFLLPAKIPVAELWQTGLQMCAMFATSLNIATVGYFWWYVPEFVSTFYEEMSDLDTKATLRVDYKSLAMANWKRTTLKAQQLHNAGMILTFLMTWATKEQSLACSRYIQGIALLSKNDVFGDFTAQAFVHFASALRMAFVSYGDWDGAPEHFDQAATDTLNGIWNQPEAVAEFKSLIEVANALEKQQQPSRPINLDEAMKLKACCDVYLVHRIGREVQKAIQKRQASAASAPPTSATSSEGEDAQTQKGETSGAV
jgi:AbiV family abortive infection protein